MTNRKIKTSKTSDARAGSTFLVVMLLTLLGSLAAGSVLVTTLMRMRIADKQVCLEQAFYIAAAGAERAAAQVADGNESDTTLTGTLGAGSYEVTVVRQNAAHGERNFDITSYGTVKNVTRRVALSGIRRVSWARYALWYDSEATKLWIAPGERFDGRVYSRPELHFHDMDLATKGQVLFADRVWTAAATIERASRLVDPIFEQGLILNAEVESMASVDFPEMLATAASDGLVLEGETSITLDGSIMRITNSRAGWVDHAAVLPNNGMVYVQTVTETTTVGTGWRQRTVTTTYPGDLNVAGPDGLDGRLTIIADNNINIVDHVRYANNPVTDSTSNDALGLIAQQNVVVHTSAPNDLDVFAHIIAQNGGFGVASYNTGPSRGMLNVYGGIVNKVRQAVGLVGGSGYSKNYVFDRRFSSTPPPNYPKVIGELEWANWDG